MPHGVWPKEKVGNGCVWLLLDRRYDEYREKWIQRKQWAVFWRQIEKA
jgi:hypothetical protein